jgi:streptogramin lyase
MGNRGAHIAALAAVALLLALPEDGRAIDLRVFHVPSADSGLRHIVAGPDGALWFTERKANKVGRITTGGQITEYPVPNNASGLEDTGPDEIVSGRDGALWFLADIGESVYRLTPDGAYRQVYFDQLNNASDLAPSDTGGVWLLMAHGDGNDQDGDALLRVDPNGTTTAYRATHPNTLDAIALGPDGSAWYNNAGSDLNQVTDAGSQDNTPLASPSVAQEVSSIAFDRSDTPWFTEFTPGPSPARAAAAPTARSSAALRTSGRWARKHRSTASSPTRSCSGPTERCGSRSEKRGRERGADSTGSDGSTQPADRYSSRT